MNFSQVKKIIVPVEIQPTATWHELSIRSEQASRYFSSGSYECNLPISSFSGTAHGTGKTPRIRIYFTWNGNSGYPYTFQVNGETVSSLSSPIDITLTPIVSAGSAAVIQITQKNPDYSNGWRRLTLGAGYRSSSDSVEFTLYGHCGTTSTSELLGEFILTVNRIEQYYLDDPTPIIQNVEVKKIEDSNGVVLWKKPEPQTFTISYRKTIYQNTLPASKVVPAGYVLTAEDLPLITDSANWQVIGWTIDGVNTISVGYVVNSDIELCAVHEGNWTTGSFAKSDSEYKSTGSPTATVSITLGLLDSGTNSFTSSVSKIYTNSDSTGYSYKKAYICRWSGIVAIPYIEHAARIEWTPSRSSVSFTNNATSSQGTITNVNTITTCYPTMLLRYNDTKGYIGHIQNSNTNKQVYTSPEPHTGSSIRVYIQYGGAGGGNNMAYRSGKAFSNSSSMGSISVSNPSGGKTTETVYLYTLPSA